MAAFGKWFDLPDLRMSHKINTAASSALIGFQLRNRRFRRDGHDSAVEFVVQRWCGCYSNVRPWALSKQDIGALHAEFAADVAQLLAAITPAEAATLLQDPRWLEASAYDAVPAPQLMQDPVGLAKLYEALVLGLAACAVAAGRQPPALPPSPSAYASIETWDAVLLQAINALLDADSILRDRLRNWRYRTRWAFGAG